jgi:pimeloyl-ACP methyl ester carboxylesterase
MPKVEINGTNIHYEVKGEGKTILLVLGPEANISEWSSLINGLARHYQVVAFDQRGCGRSQKTKNDDSIETMADDAAILIEKLNVDNANILGISMGSRIAMEITLRHPEKVKRLILAATACSTTNNRRFLALDSLTYFVKSKYPQFKGARQKQHLASVLYDCSTRIGKIQVPTLILHGRKDKITPFELVNEIHKNIKGSEMVEFDGGHLFPLAQGRDVFLDSVQDFIG